jgi:uncharacterized 2Fe-2S/4Fe-4S cluster protein (DUF4445 family)
MIKVTIRYGAGDEVVLGREGDLLLDILKKSGKLVSAPCGGLGICGKCMVTIAGLGSRQACRHVLSEDIEISMPVSGQACILESAFGDQKQAEGRSGIETTSENGVFTVKYEGAVIDTYTVTPGEKPEQFGVALDIGTTTVVAYLEDLRSHTTVDVASFVNPQTGFGHDVISRIHYVMNHDSGLRTLRDTLIGAVNTAMDAMQNRTGVKSRDIYKITVVGNPTMLHFFCGIDPSTIAQAPYMPAFFAGRTMTGRETGLHMNPGGVVRVLPLISGFVGADVVAGIASTSLADSDGFSLYMDIGTNGEMACGNRDIIFCCASAAGPAFEGATIRCGVGGVRGAICSVGEEGYATIGAAPPIGICGSGVVDITALLLNKGEIDRTGLMDRDFVVERAHRAASGYDIVFTPQDVREVQLAKAAIAAGIRILMKTAGVNVHDIKQVYLAGAFGNFMNIRNATAIGLIPEGLEDAVVCVGNAAGTGARLALRSVDFEGSLQRIIEKTHYIELSGRRDFNDEFVNQMNF